MSENENNFETLRRLLALKRHEIPPPGYFDNFSDHVIARIRAGEAAQPLPWVMRFFQAFEARPAYPVTFASALCLLLLFGIVSVQQTPELAQSPLQVYAPTAQVVPTAGQPLAMVNTNPPADLSLFGTSPNANFQQVGFSTAN